MNKVRKEVIAEMLKLMGEDGKKSYPKQLGRFYQEIEKRK